MTRDKAAIPISPGPTGPGVASRDRHAWWLPSNFGRGLTTGVVAAILVVGIGTSGALFVQADRIAERQESALANRATRALQTVSGNVVSSFGGASAIVGADGQVSEQSFDSLASGVVDTTLLPVLGFVQPVRDEDRAAFEASLGKPITAASPDGLVTSEHRDEYLVVRSVYPANDTSNKVVGFDISSDPLRSAAASDAVARGATVFSAPITSQPSGQMAVFAIKPLYRPSIDLSNEAGRNAAFVGFISSLVPAKAMLATIIEQLPAGANVSITDGDVLLIATPSAPHHGHEATINESGQQWSVVVEYHQADMFSAWLSLFATLLLALAVGVSLQRNRRQTTELRAAADGVRQLGGLSERLAVADTREQVLRVILAFAGDTARASTVAAAFPSADRSSLDVTRASIGGDTEPVPDRWTVTISEPTPMTDAWNTRTAVVVRDEGAFRGLYDGGATDRVERRVGSAASLPLRRPDGELIGVIAWEWSAENRFSDRTLSTLQATADLVQQSVHRADLHEQRWASASALLTLSQRLAVARTTPQIADAVIAAAAPAAGADYVSVGFLNESATAFDLFHPAGKGLTHLPITANGSLMSVLRRAQPIEFNDRAQIERFTDLHRLVGPDMERLVCMPLIDSGGNLRGILAFMFVAGAPQSRRADSGRIATIADVTAQTVERAMLYLHEHELVVNLQRQTLADLPEVAGLDMAARYLPSSATLGLGGDWYDVYVLEDGRIGAVVGDVSGHGIDAIADMTEFRTTISTLLRTNPDLGEISSLSSTLLRDDESDDVRFATAGLMLIDRVAGELAYVRAGHPPMFVLHPDGEVVVLEAGGGGPIGMTSESVVVQTVGISSGSVIVAYTDGLIERREESIDVGLTRLRSALAECVGMSAEAIADHVVERCLGNRQTADDTALLVIRVDGRIDGVAG